MRIAAYCRVSTDHEDQLNSLENQREFFAEYAKKNGHQLIHVYADEGISGTSLKKRTEFKRLMSDSERGVFDMVVVKDVSRFARNTVDFLQNIRQLKARGINTIFVTTNMDSLGDSEFILTIFSAMAQEESANLSKRVKFGKHINAEKGRVPKHVYGYNRIDNFTLEINPIEASVVKRIFHMYTEEGIGARRIAIALNNEGIPTKFGNKWDSTGIRRILKNSIYCGDYVNGKYEVEDYLTGKLVPTAPEKHMHHERPEWAIISRETFEKVDLQFQARCDQYNSGEPFKGARYSNKYVFSTLIKCAVCGASYSRKVYQYKTRMGEPYWKCTTLDRSTKRTCYNATKIFEKDLLDTITNYLRSLIADEEAFIQKIVDDALQALDAQTDGASIAELEARKEALEKRKSKLQDMFLNDLMTMEVLKSKSSAIDEELAQIEYELLRLSGSDSQRDNIHTLAEEYAKAVKHFLQLDDITNVEMRKVVENIIVDHSGNVTINLKKLQK